mmetsp:Transcript_60216/g.191291  ORF Transcript_60216/g.191291 Transcript_60216/m.191291 type:complete len:534 (-) Transcript_60216:584-2185(-)
MHTVLHLQAERLHPQKDEALEHALAEPGLGCHFVGDDGPELAMVAHKHHLLGAHHERDQGLGLRALRGLVDEHDAEAQVGQAGVARAHAGRADHVGVLQDLSLRAPLERAVLLFIRRRKLPLLLLEHLQLAQLGLPGQLEVLHLVVEGEVLHGREDALAGLRTQADHFEPCHRDLFRELVDCHVGGRRHDHLPHVLLGEVVDQRGRRHGLPRPRRSLDEAEGAPERAPHGVDLRVVELREAWGREHPGHVGLHRWEGVGVAVTEKLVVNDAADAGLVQDERLECVLHAIHRHALPHEVDAEARCEVHRRPHRGAQLDAHLLVGGLLDHLPGAAPLVVRGIAGVADHHLVAHDELHVRLIPREDEVCDVLLVQPHVPPHHDVVPRLVLQHLLLVIPLQLHQGSEGVLVAVRVLVLECDLGDLVLVALVLQVLQGGFGPCLPHVLELGDVPALNSPRCAQHLLLLRLLDEPMEEGAVVDEGLPLVHVPVHLLEAVRGEAGLAAEEHHHALGLGRDEAEEEDVLTPAVVALEDLVA